jgi:hypothetical protein
VIARKLGVAEDLEPGAGGAPAEERGVVLEQPGAGISWSARAAMLSNVAARTSAEISVLSLAWEDAAA